MSICVVLLFVPFLYGNSDPDIVFDRFLGLVAGLAVYIALLQFDLRKADVLLLLSLLLGAVLIEAIIGWLQLYTNSRHIDLAPYNNTSPAGVFQQVNVMASFLAGGLVMSGYLATRYAELEPGVLRRILWVPVLAVPVLAIHLLLFLSSRTGLLGAVVGVSLLFPLVWQTRRQRLVYGWIGAMVIGLLLSLSIENLGVSGFQGAGKNVISLQSLRSIHMPQTVNMILERPVSGYGYGKFERSYVEYTAKRYADGEDPNPGIGGLDHPHNELLMWATEGGIVALAALLLAAWFVWSAIVKLPVPQRLAAVAVLFPIVLHTQLEYPFYISLANWISFILLIYWIDSRVEANKSVRSEQTLIFATGAILIPSVTTLFMVTTLQSGYILARYELGQEDDVSTMNNMLNPVVWHDRMLLAINFRLVLNGISFRDPGLAQSFIDWAPGYLARYPRPDYYRYLMLAYQVSGDIPAATQIRDRAAYLFPGMTFELVDLDQFATAPDFGRRQ